MDLKTYPFLLRVSLGAQWLSQGDYPAWPAVADEHERWLQFLDAKRRLGNYLPRLRGRAHNRDEALAEIATAYFLDRHCGLAIDQWEPPGLGHRQGEFLVRLPGGRPTFVEVKSPGWEAEIAQVAGGPTPRLYQPKYQAGEGGATAPWASVRHAVKKAHPQLPDTLPTLLVIHDDLKVGLNDWLTNVEIGLYCPRGRGIHPTGYLAEDGCFVGPTYPNLGAVGVLNVNFPVGEGVRYRFTLFDNPHGVAAVAVPDAAFAGFPRHRGPTV